MNKPQTDKWRARGSGDSGASDAIEQALGARHREERALQLRVARLLWEAERTRAFRLHACSSIAQFGEVFGRSATEARWLAAVGRVLEIEPAVEEEILAGGISIEAGAALLRGFTCPALARSGIDWLEMARHRSARRLRDLMDQVEREATSGERVTHVTVLMTDSGREDFSAARRLLSRRNKRVVAGGEAVEMLSRCYLDREDPARKRPARRRMPHTAGHPGRTVPAEVVRELLARNDGRCPVSLCDHRIWMDMAHRVPHRHGGSREADNLAYLCRQHHGLLDSGLMRMAGSLEEPRCYTADGRRVGERLRLGARKGPDTRGGGP